MRGNPDRQPADEGGRLLGTIAAVLFAAWVTAHAMSWLVGPTP